MTDREAFEQWGLSKEGPWLPRSYQRRPGTGEYYYTDVAYCWMGWQAALAYARDQVSGWIPVSERLPEEAQPVLIPYYPVPIVAYWDRNADLQVRWWKFGEPNFPLETRHWAPLPAAPLPQVKYGCHVDLEPGMSPDGCVIDQGRPEDCIYARRGMKKEECKYWRPINLPQGKEVDNA